MKTSWMLGWLVGLPLVAAELKVGDEIRVTLRGVPADDSATVTGDYVVNERGEVRLHLLDTGVPAVGRSPLQLAERIETAYREAGIYQQPRVEVAAAKSKQAVGARVSVGGEVRRSGAVEYRDGLTVLQAIDAAGGRTEFGGRNLLLIRKGRQFCLDFKQLEHLNIVLQPDDSLRVDSKPAFIDRWEGSPERVAALKE